MRRDNKRRKKVDKAKQNKNELKTKQNKRKKKHTPTE